MSSWIIWPAGQPIDVSVYVHLDVRALDLGVVEEAELDDVHPELRVLDLAQRLDDFLLGRHASRVEDREPSGPGLGSSAADVCRIRAENEGCGLDRPRSRDAGTPRAALRIATSLRHARHDANITQAEAWRDRLGVRLRTVEQWEWGTRAISPELAEHLTAALGQQAAPNEATDSPAVAATRASPRPQPAQPSLSELSAKTAQLEADVASSSRRIRELEVERDRAQRRANAQALPDALSRDTLVTAQKAARDVREDARARRPTPCARPASARVVRPRKWTASPSWRASERIGPWRRPRRSGGGSKPVLPPHPRRPP